MSCASASWSGLRSVRSRGYCQGEAATCSTFTADVPVPSAGILGWLVSEERAQMYSSSSLRPGSHRVGSRRCAGERASGLSLEAGCCGRQSLCRPFLAWHSLVARERLLRVPSRVQCAAQAM